MSGKDREPPRAYPLEPEGLSVRIGDYSGGPDWPQAPRKFPHIPPAPKTRPEPRRPKPAK